MIAYLLVLISLSIPVYAAAVVDIANVKWEENMSPEVYKNNGLAIIKDVGDKVLPLTFTALSLTLIKATAKSTVIGTMAIAAFSFLWDIFSGGLNEEEKERQLIKKIMDISEKQAKKVVAQDVKGRINAALQTSDYSCKEFAGNLGEWYMKKDDNDSTKMDKILEQLRISYNSCDNFQASVVYQLLNTEYSDVLLTPMVMSMVLYNPFSREAIDHGTIWGLTPDKVARMRDNSYTKMDKMINLFGEGLVKKHKNKRPDIYVLEGEACKMMQTQLYYNKDLYPYGVPWRDDKNNTISTEYQKHLQFFNNTEGQKLSSFFYKKQMNCIMGPMFTWFNTLKNKGQQIDFNIVKRGMYEVRVIYYHVFGNISFKRNFEISEISDKNKLSEVNRIAKKYSAPIITKDNNDKYFKVANFKENSKFIIKRLGYATLEKGVKYHIIADNNDMSRDIAWSFVGVELVQLVS